MHGMHDSENAAKWHLPSAVPSAEQYVGFLAWSSKQQSHAQPAALVCPLDGRMMNWRCREYTSWRGVLAPHELVEVSLPQCAALY
jgi:hypothetical protein